MRSEPEQPSDDLATDADGAADPAPSLGREAHDLRELRLFSRAAEGERDAGLERARQRFRAAHPFSPAP